jgi:glutathione S-transferase
MLGVEPNEAKTEETKAVLRKSERLLENYFLKETKFIHSNEISIADLQALCEFTQFWITGKDPLQEKPRLTQWLEDCKKELQPHFDNAHEMIYIARDRDIFKGKL